MNEVTALYELCKKRGYFLRFDEVGRRGPGHQLEFLWKATINGFDYVAADWQRNKGAAKVEAAKVALENLLEEDGIAFHVNWLYDHCAKNGLVCPVYNMIETDGPPQMPKFRYEVVTSGMHYVGDWMRTEKLAQGAAAKVARIAIETGGETPQKQQQSLGKRSVESAFGSTEPPRVSKMTPFQLPSASVESINELNNTADFDRRDLQLLHELAQKRMVVMQDIYETVPTGFVCYLMWDGVRMPTSRPFTRKKDAKAHACTLTLTAMGCKGPPGADTGNEPAKQALVKQFVEEVIPDGFQYSVVVKNRQVSKSDVFVRKAAAKRDAAAKALPLLEEMVKTGSLSDADDSFNRSTEIEGLR
ncbi:HLA class II histocompatibility antigen, DR beta 4 chain [Irineochytrium annulatum]|nr:HLA class II histocompatibility antigen, DR beta 4 chain [Irineochytrium annulatum]